MDNKKLLAILDNLEQHCQDPHRQINYVNCGHTLGGVVHYYDHQFLVVSNTQADLDLVKSRLGPFPEGKSHDINILIENYNDTLSKDPNKNSLTGLDEEEMQKSRDNIINIIRSLREAHRRDILAWIKEKRESLI